MSLPDISRLPLLYPNAVRELSARLRALGVDRAAIAPFMRHGERLLDRMRRPVRAFHLRREQSPLGFALRLFVFMDPVSREQALSVLASETLLATLLEAGLLEEREASVVCPFFLNLIDDLYVFCDDLTNGGDAVMGAGTTTARILQAAWTGKPLERALDLGCGAGSAALMLSRQAAEVVGTDINPRAIALAELNLALAECANVRFLEGDLFAPVAEERFNLILAQPPFVSKPDSEQPVTFLHGGARGDELVLRMLSELPPRLAPGGRALLLVDWPRYDDVSPTARIRGALGAGSFDLLLLTSSCKDLGEYVAHYTVGLRPDLGEVFDQAVLAHLEHLTRLGVTELRTLLVVIRATEQTPWTHQIMMRDDAKPTGAQIERLIAAQDLLAADSAKLRAARLVVPEGTRFAQDESGQIRVELDPSRLIGSVICSQSAADLLSAVHQGKSVANAVATIAQQLKLNHAAGRAQILEGIRTALGEGLLELELEADLGA